MNNVTLWNDTYYFKPEESNEINSSLLNSSPVKEENGFLNKNYKSYKVDGLDTNNNIIYKFSSLRKDSLGLNISRVSIVRCLDKGSIWNGKYKFKKG